MAKTTKTKTKKATTTEHGSMSEVVALKKKLFDIKFNRHTTGIQKPHEMKNIKKDIARKLTQINAQKNK